MLEYLDEYGSPGLGAFWSGKTDGWIQPDMFTPAVEEIVLEAINGGLTPAFRAKIAAERIVALASREYLGDCCACERPIYADEMDEDGWMKRAILPRVEPSEAT